ncbi:MAG: phosphoribosylanthranilate isomerase, partial [Elusimicrobiota bacterium]
MLIKICGITNKKDRDSCIKSGADLIGYNIYPGSKRYMVLPDIKNLITEKNRKISVIVGVNLDFSGWKSVVTSLKPGFIQLHGSENINLIKELKNNFPRLKLIKKVTHEEIDKMESILRYADYLLWDSKSESHGGTGRRFNWKLLNKIPGEVKDRLFVAGGINPDNVTELFSYEVYGVDVASGVEENPGVKD